MARFCSECGLANVGEGKYAKMCELCYFKSTVVGSAKTRFGFALKRVWKEIDNE